MNRIVKHGGDVISTAAGIVLGVTILIGVNRGLGFLPLLDGKIMPVIKFLPTTNVYREAHNATYTSGRVCFTLNMEKLKNATPEPYQFWVQLTSGLSPRLGMAVHLATDRNTRMPDQNYGKSHPAGAAWQRRYCGELPGPISDNDEISIGGYAFHWAHPLWETETVIPQFTVNPATGLTP